MLIDLRGEAKLILQIKWIVWDLSTFTLSLHSVNAYIYLFDAI